MYNLENAFQFFIGTTCKNLKNLKWPYLFSPIKIRKSFWAIRFHSDVFIITSLREKCPYLEFFCSVFSHNGAEYGEILCISLYLSVFSPSAGKYGPDNVRIQTLFTQCLLSCYSNFSRKTYLVPYKTSIIELLWKQLVGDSWRKNCKKGSSVFPS